MCKVYCNLNVNVIQTTYGAKNTTITRKFYGKTNIFIRNENDIIYNEIYSFRFIQIIFHINLWSSITNIN